MTLSARTSTLGGIVRPICLAAFRLMMNSNSGRKDNCQNKEAKIFCHFFYCYLRPLVSLLTLHSSLSLFRKLLDESRRFHFLHETRIDEAFRIRRRGFGSARSHVIQ